MNPKTLSHIFKSCLLLTALLIPQTALSGTSTGTVRTVIVNASNFLFFEAGTISNRASCGGSSNQWAVNINSTNGKSLFTLVLFAKSTGRSITVVGTGACNSWGDREDALYALIPD